MAENSDEDKLLKAFKKFPIHRDTKATGKELNGKNWAKFCKDCKIIDGKHVTGTEVDIIFTKVRSNNIKCSPEGLHGVINKLIIFSGTEAMELLSECLLSMLLNIGWTAKVITYEEFQRALQELALRRFRDQSQDEALQSICKLVEGQGPANIGVTKAAKIAAVDRLTDTSRYTGSHKERFDESGRGKGREGREEINENTGYVGAYKNAGTFDIKKKTEK